MARQMHSTNQNETTVVCTITKAKSDNQWLDRCPFALIDRYSVHWQMIQSYMSRPILLHWQIAQKASTDMTIPDKVSSEAYCANLIVRQGVTMHPVNWIMTHPVQEHWYNKGCHQVRRGYMNEIFLNNSTAGRYGEDQRRLLTYLAGMEELPLAGSSIKE